MKYLLLMGENTFWHTMMVLNLKIFPFYGFENPCLIHVKCVNKCPFLS